MGWGDPPHCPTTYPTDAPRGQARGPAPTNHEQIRDIKAALKDVQDREEKELERAIKGVQGKGVKVSRDDWKFPNWDPTKDYTDADYKALG